MSRPLAMMGNRRDEATDSKKAAMATHVKPLLAGQATRQRV